MVFLHVILKYLEDFKDKIENNKYNSIYIVIATKGRKNGKKQLELDQLT